MQAGLIALETRFELLKIGDCNHRRLIGLKERGGLLKWNPAAARIQIKLEGERSVHVDDWILCAQRLADLFRYAFDTERGLHSGAFHQQDMVIENKKTKHKGGERACHS